MSNQPDQQRINELAEKWLNGTITDAEAKEFAQWYDDSIQEETPVDAAFAQTREELSERIFQAVHNGTTSKVVPFYRRAIFARSVAAAVIIIISGIIYYTQSGTKNITTSTVASAAQNITAPTQTKAILTLADGSTVELDAAANGAIAQQNGAAIIKKDGALIYSANAAVNNAVNTVSIPKGSLPVQLTLSDGSQVWLNAASSMTYPVVFNGNKREVKITGEVYFDIAQNKTKPFVVQSPDQEIEVLGTVFNVNAYADERAAVTTLINGSVKITAATKAVILKPGEQAIKQHKMLDTKKVSNPGRFTAWKDNRFVFGEQMDIETIMRIIARWYNIEIQYHGKPQLHFGGSLPRNISLQQLLQTLEKTGGAHFRVEGNTVHVRP